MEYQIGDKVQLEDGRIVEITGITKVDGKIMYGQGKPYCIIDQKIIKKIED